MMTPQKQDLTILQGATFTWPFYWYSDTEVPCIISAVTRSYPTLLTCTAHGAPAGRIPVTLLGVPTWLKSASLDKADRIYATKVDANTFSVPVDGIAQDAYTGTAGRLVYNSPMDLSTGWTARMQVRSSLDDDTVIQEFTSLASHIVLAADGSATLTLSATETDALDFDSGAVYDLELDNGSEVSRIAYGKVNLSRQVTR